MTAVSSLFLIIPLIIPNYSFNYSFKLSHGRRVRERESWSDMWPVRVHA